jgi:putative addiction module component (TIGR02574 family)
MHPLLNQEVSQISVDDRLDLIDLLWESLSELSESLSVTDAQKAELDRRLLNLQNDPTAGSSWEEVKQRLGKRQ